MCEYSKDELESILKSHRDWLNNDGGKRAVLRGANLRYANLWGANLRYANLWGANLRGANLRYANLCYANLWGANLWDANLRDADLRDADLCYANLRDADLRGADLRGADLLGVIGNAKNIKTILIDSYCIVYTDTILQIGCERHQIEEWWKFSNKEIINMDGPKAQEFWDKYRDIIKQMIEISPAEPTGYKEK